MSVLQIVGTVAGAAIGYAIGNVPGALLGASLGGAVGGVANSIINPPRVEGARIGDLSVTSSAAGAVRPIGYGRVRISGNVIWAIPLIEHSKTTSSGGGKGGGPTTTTFDYGATFALGLCEGPVDAVIKIWADSKLVYDASGGSDTIQAAGFNFRFYPGNGTQTADSIIESHEGLGNVPGYRGTCYLVFDDIPLANYGNRIPNITVELAFNATQVSDVTYLDRSSSVFAGLYDGAVAVNPLSHVGYVFGDGTVGVTGIVEFSADSMTTIREELMSDLLAPLAFADTGGDNPGGSPMIGWDEALYFITGDTTNGPHIIRVDPNTLLATAAFSAPPGSTFTTSTFPGAYQLCFLAQIDSGSGIVSQLIAANADNQVGGLDLPAMTFNWLRNDLDGTTSVGICQGKIAAGLGEGYVMAISGTTWYISKMTFSGGTTTVALVSTYVPNDFYVGAVSFDAAGGLGGLIYDESDDSVVFHVSMLDGSSSPIAVTSKWSQTSGIIFNMVTPSDVYGEASSSPMSRISGGTYSRLNLTVPTVTTIDAATGALLSNDTWPVGLSSATSTQEFDSGSKIIIAYVQNTSSIEAGWAKLRLDRITGSATTLADIVLDQCERAGFIADDVDVTALTDPIAGYIIGERALVVDVLKPLFQIYLVDAVESDYILKFTHRGRGAGITIYTGFWDLATLVPPTTLSIDNLTAILDHTGSTVAEVRSTPPINRPLVYFIFSPDTVGASSAQALGICNAAYGVFGGIPGFGDTNSVGFFVPGSLVGGDIFFNGASIGVAAQAVQGNVCIFALDAIHQKVWLSTDGGTTWNSGGGTGGDPTLGTGGYSAPGFTGPFYMAIHISSTAGARNTVTILPTAGFHLTSAIALTEDDLLRVDDNTPVYTETRQQEIELPMRVTLTYTDSDKNYQVNTQIAKRARNPNPTVFTDNQTDLQLAVVSTATPAKQLAEVILYSIWNERSTWTARLPPKFGTVDVADRVTLTLSDGHQITGRFGKTDVGVDHSIDVTIIQESEGQFESTVVAAPGVPWPGSSSIPTANPSKLILIDSPLLRDTDDLSGTAMRGYWGGASYQSLGGWPGGTLRTSSDTDTWTIIDGSGSEMTWGALVVPPPDPASFFRTQRDGTMTIKITGGTGVPTTTNDLGLANFANPMIVIKANREVEVIQYRDVTPLGGGQYTLSVFYRGVRGTDAMGGGLASGDLFVLLDTISVRNLALPISDVSINEFYQLITVGALSASALLQGFIFHGRDLMPYAPCSIAGALSGSDIILTWIRRTRFGGSLRPGIGTVPLNEATEAYQVDILDGVGGSVLRTLSVTAPTATYTAANITADFGSTPAELSLNVYQMSAVVGRGFSTEALLEIA